MNAHSWSVQWHVECEFNELWRKLSIVSSLTTTLGPSRFKISCVHSRTLTCDLLMWYMPRSVKNACWSCDPFPKLHLHFLDSGSIEPVVAMYDYCTRLWLCLWLPCTDKGHVTLCRYTVLIWDKKVSWIVRCPDFRMSWLEGFNLTCKWDKTNQIDLWTL